jgi:hypothetical protein
MPKINFSAHYPKLYGQQNGRLLRVDCLPLAELPWDFLEYDTRQTTGEHYKFPFKNAMVLILTFQGNRMIPFTTVRRSYAKKFLWYKSQIGQLFDIVVNEDKPEAVQEAITI